MKNNRLTKKIILKNTPDQSVDDVSFCLRNIDWKSLSSSEKEEFEEVVFGFQSNMIGYAKTLGMNSAYMFFATLACIVLLLMMLFGCTYKSMVIAIFATLIGLICLTAFAKFGAKILYEEQLQKIHEVVKLYNRKHHRE